MTTPTAPSRLFRPFHEPGDRVPPRGETTVLALIGAASVAGLVAGASGSVTWVHVLFVAGLCLVGELLSVSFDEGLTVAPHDMFVAVAVVALGWTEALLVGVAVVAWRVIRDARSIEQMNAKAVFTLAPLLAMLAAVHAVELPASVPELVVPVLLVAIAVLAQWGAEALLLLLVGLFGAGGKLRPSFEFVRGAMATLPTDFLAQVPMAAVGLVVWEYSPVYLACLLAPMVVSWLSLHQSAQLEQAQRQIGIDALTGIANRGAFNGRIVEEVELAQRYEHRLALVLGDLDDFKKVNDTLGHQVGDEVLIATAAALEESARDVACHVARFGGEEFVAIVPVVDMRESLELAESLRHAVEDRCGAWNVSISFGVAYLEPGEDVPELVARADRALYAAKYAGKNRVFHQPGDAQEPFDARLTLATLGDDLRPAV